MGALPIQSWLKYALMSLGFWLPNPCPQNPVTKWRNSFLYLLPSTRFGVQRETRPKTEVKIEFKLLTHFVNRNQLKLSKHGWVFLCLRILQYIYNRQLDDFIYTNVSETSMTSLRKTTGQDALLFHRHWWPRSWPPPTPWRASFAASRSAAPRLMATWPATWRWWRRSSWWRLGRKPNVTWKKLLGIQLNWWCLKHCSFLGWLPFQFALHLMNCQTLHCSVASMRTCRMSRCWWIASLQAPNAPGSLIKGSTISSPKMLNVNVYTAALGCIFFVFFFFRVVGFQLWKTSNNFRTPSCESVHEGVFGDQTVLYQRTHLLERFQSIDVKSKLVKHELNVKTVEKTLIASSAPRCAYRMRIWGPMCSHCHMYSQY